MARVYNRSTRYGIPLHNYTNNQWGSLPGEIRLMILEAIARQKHPGWSSCAAVCKEWQCFIESKNFHRLTLTVLRLGQLNQMFPRQRILDKHIYFKIELPRYNCRSCKSPNYISSRNNVTTRNAVMNLFSILNEWKPMGQLKLELYADSSSDAEHWFKNYSTDSDGEGSEGGDGSDKRLSGSPIRWHDPKHGWINGTQVNGPPGLAVLRWYNRIDLRPAYPLPRVEAVTSLLVRRQVRRSLTPSSLGLVLRSLPRLECLVYEPWRMYDILTSRRAYDEGKFSFFFCYAPLSVLLGDSKMNSVLTIY